VGACVIARALRPITAAVTSIAATKRLVIWAWSFFIGGAFTGDVSRCQQEKTKILLMAFAAGFVNFGQQQSETTNYLNAADRKVAPKWPHSKARFADKIEGSDFSSSATATTALTHRG
jgi:hypothetical protein